MLTLDNKTLLKKHIKTGCNLCGSTDQKKVYSFQNYSLVRCEKCSLYFLDPLLTSQEIKQIYSKEYYFSSDSNEFGYSDYKKDVDSIIMTAVRRFVDIEKYCPGKGKILDVGCAFGYYLDIARLHEWEAVGVELSEESSKEGRLKLKLNIQSGGLVEQNFPDESFDVVTCWDLIEHLADPQNFLEEARRILKKDGFLFLTTPDIESIPSKIMKSQWMGIKSREHQYFFSRKSLKRYFEKNGFQMIDCRYEGKYVTTQLFFDRIKYYFGGLTNILTPAKFLLPPIFYVNPFDILFAGAKKL